MAQASDPHQEWLSSLTDKGRTNYLENVEGLDCLKCHAEVGEEWRHSLHAIAWTDEHYQKSLTKVRRKNSCYGCHAPTDLAGTDLTKKPPVRSEQRHLGIHCASCHLDSDGVTILGPAGHATDAHPSRKSELFDSETSSKMCIACHETTIGPVIGIARDFEDTEQQDLGLSCVGCHMPGLRRSWANDEDGTPGPVRKSHSHRLETPRDPVFLRSAFLLSAKRDGEATVFRIENQIGHRVPGLKERKIQFDIELFDAVGDSVATAEHVIDHRAYLPVEESFEMRLEAVGSRLMMKATHTTPALSRGVVFWEREFTFE
ncbi:MAG: hypothetical protein ACI841_003407 [Planctomycetota bacterium]|jgi:hypothetical protein